MMREPVVVAEWRGVRAACFACLGRGRRSLTWFIARVNSYPYARPRVPAAKLLRYRYFAHGQVGPVKAGPRIATRRFFRRRPRRSRGRPGESRATDCNSASGPSGAVNYRSAGERWARNAIGPASSSMCAHTRGRRKPGGGLKCIFEIKLQARREIPHRDIATLPRSFHAH